MRLRCYQLKVIFPCMKTYSLNVTELHLKRIWHNNKPVIIIMWKKLYKASFTLYIANAVAEKRIYVIDFFPLNIIGGKSACSWNQLTVWHLKLHWKSYTSLTYLLSAIWYVYKTKVLFLRWYIEIKKSKYFFTYFCCTEIFLFVL